MDAPSQNNAAGGLAQPPRVVLDALTALGVTIEFDPVRPTEAWRLRSDRGDASLQTADELLRWWAQSHQSRESASRELDALSGQLAHTYEELSLIYQLSTGMRLNRGIDEFFASATTELLGVMSVESAAYQLCHAIDRCDAPSIVGPITLPEPAKLRLGSDLLMRLRTDARPILVNRIQQGSPFGYLGRNVRNLVAAPLQRQDRVMGWVGCLNKSGDEFTTADSKLLNSIASQTAVFLENTALFNDVRGLMMGLLHALTSAVDAKDTYTRGHSQRVAVLSREIARMAGLPETAVDRIYMAGLLHDVGKIGVAEAVLRKPGRLTDDEFDQMKRHVEIGAHILADIKQVADLVPGVLHHHERYDGKGYPHGLAGQDIPLIARVICVADSFDAMTSNRTYRRALPIEAALVEVRRCAGTQFDPLFADAINELGADEIRTITSTIGVEEDRRVERLAA
jgi:HD-GYP domain-containing protein (c-di-GMP phosphodiesterase class II)